MTRTKHEGADGPSPDDIRQAFDEGFGLSKLGGPIETAWERSEARQAAGLARPARPPTAADLREQVVRTFRNLPDEAFGFVASQVIGLSKSAGGFKDDSQKGLTMMAGAVMQWATAAEKS